MKKFRSAFFAILAHALSQCAALAADVMPIWQNDTVANSVSFNDTFGHQVSIGTYNPSTGAFSASMGSVSIGATFTGGMISITGSPVTGSGTLAFTVAGISGGIPYFSSATTWASSPALLANQIVLGGGAGGAPSTPVGLGTSTQVLHGNASGAPTFGVIVSADLATVLSSPPSIGNTLANTVAASTLTVPSLPGLSTAVTFTSPFSGAPSFGLALPSVAAPWIIAATATSPATDNPGGLFFVNLNESQTLKSVTISNASPAVVTLTAHGLTAGKAVAFLGTLGSPLTTSTTYYVCAAGLTANTFEISTTSNCASPINTSGASSGVTMASNQGLPGTSPSIYAYTQIAQGSVGNYIGTLGYVANSNTMASQPLGVASAIGAQGIAICVVAGCSSDWGGLVAIYDTTGTANPANPQLGLEVDNYANGTDTNGNRVGIQIQAGTPFGTGTVNTVTNGILMGGNGATGGGQYVNLFNSTAHTTNGINLSGATFAGGGFAFTSPAFSVDGLGNMVANTLTLALNNQVQWGSNTGTTGGQIVMVSAGGGWFFDDRGSGGIIYRTGSTPTEVFRITSAGVLTAAGTAGVTCAAGFSASTGRSVNGVVTHC